MKRRFSLTVILSFLILACAKSPNVPYQANLIIVDPTDDTEENCSGSIIHERWILTAAHCFARFRYPRYLIVAVGTSEFSGANGTEYEYESHVVHEHWNRTPVNDVALVRVKTDVIFNERVQRIQLSKNRTLGCDDVTAVLSSWPAMENDEPAPTLQLKNLTIVTRERCLRELLTLIKSLGNSPYDRDFFTKATIGLDKLLCTLSDPGDRRPCHGDSGGPLVANRTLLGVVSSSYACSGRPGLFTRVSSFVDWIHAQLTHRGDRLS